MFVGTHLGDGLYCTSLYDMIIYLGMYYMYVCFKSSQCIVLCIRLLYTVIRVSEDLVDICISIHRWICVM